MTGATPTVPPQELTRRTSRLTWLYITALSSVAVLTILGQILVQWSLSRQIGDSAVVNVAGRQRMLSQKLAKAAIGLQHAQSPLERQQRREEIQATLALWQSAHVGLQQGDPSLSLPGPNSAEVNTLFAELDPTFRAIQSAADQLLAGDAKNGGPSDAVGRDAVATILANEDRFLIGMDAIVAQYEREARGRVNRLQAIERVLLVLTLSVLVCEGALVFRPAVAQVRLAASEVLKSRQQLEVAKEAAESANQQKTQFLANISHELRNPLHAVLGNLELLGRTPLDSRQQSFVATADDSARSLEQLLNDLLDMARIESGHISISSDSFNLRDLAERCLAMHDSQAAAKGIQLRGELGDSNVWLIGDPLRLRQILVNLLSNALKFTEQGHVLLRMVRKQSSGLTESVPITRFEVTDTGIGVPPEQQSRIFDAFVQVDASSRREFGGAGLGLAITSRLVALMGGTCGVVSEFGRGSTFWVELPLRVAQAPAKPLVSQVAAHQVGRADQCHSPLNVLVVDDDEVNRRLVEESLAILGHTCYSAADGATAIAMAEKLELDAVLLDLHLPIIDGYEVARHIRNHNPAAKQRPAIIAVSAASDLSQAQSEAGLFDLVLRKPAGVQQIDDALQAMSLEKGNSNHHPVNGFTAVSTNPETSGRLDDRWLPVLQRLQGRQELFCSLARLFLEGLPEQRAELEEARNDGRMQEVIRTAHTMRGQAILFAAGDLAAALLELERHAASSNHGDCERYFAEAMRMAQQLCDELQEALTQMDACQSAV